MEANPQDFPFSNPELVTKKLGKFLDDLGADKTKTVSPEELQSLGCLRDQEIITLLRKYATEDNVQINLGEVFN